MTKTPKERKTKRSLIEVLREAGGSLTPEELFSGSGIGEDLIDEFYSELSEQCRRGLVVQHRDGQGRITLQLTGASQ